MCTPRSTRSVFTGAVVAALLFAPTTAIAQDGPPVAAPHRQTVSTNPFGLMFEWFNAEYERTLTARPTWGVSGSYLGIDGFDYANGNVVFRFYPQGAALHGFFVGSRTGVFRVSDDDEAATLFGAGFEVGYNWLLGSDQNFDVSIGVGATRLVGGALSGAPVVIPTIRLINLGISF